MQLDENVWLTWSERLNGFQRGAGSNPITFKLLYVLLIRLYIVLQDKFPKHAESHAVFLLQKDINMALESMENQQLSEPREYIFMCYILNNTFPDLIFYQHSVLYQKKRKLKNIKTFHNI